MAIPAMITGFGEQSANYGAVVGQSLQQLGQQVGQQLAMREYQKQAQAVLPALQQTYATAMDKIQSGNVTEGYRDILNAQLQFGSTQNPFIANMNQMAGSIAEKAASDFLKMKQYEIQYGRTGTGGGVATGMPGISGAEEAMTRMRGGQPNVVTTPPTTAAGQPPGQPTGTLLLPGAIVEPELPMGEGGAEGGALTRDQAAQPDAAMEGVAGMEPDPVQVATRNSFNQAMSAPPAIQTRAFQSTIAGTEETSGWKPQTVEGISRFFPKENISDTIAIAPVGTQVKYSETWTGETDKPGARFTGGKDTIVDKTMNDRATEYSLGLQNDVNLLINTGPEDRDEKWIDIIEEAGGIQNVNTSKTKEGTTDVFKIKAKGKPAEMANEQVYNAIAKIKGFSAIASETGIKILPELETGPGVRERKFGSVEEALTSGIPFGETVYVLEAGRYRPRTFKAQDRQALEWLKDNPNHPSAAEIKTRLGIK